MTTEETTGQTPGSPNSQADEWTETYVDVMEMATERAQQAWDTADRFAREHPQVVGAMAAVAVGALVGVALATIAPRRRRPTPLERAGEAVRERRRGFGMRMPMPDGRLAKARSAAELVPLGLRLLRNPLVRELAVRVALSAMRRRKAHK